MLFRSDTITVYAKNDATIRTSVSKVYWGVKPILTLKSDSTTPISNGTVTYTAQLLNPVTGEPMSNRPLRVVFAENMGKEGTHATATAAGLYGQRLYQDVYGQSNTLGIKTDSNGIAKFYVTASHEAVTPIVFYDYPTFYTNVLYDSSQYLASFAGNNNEKFDARELNAKADIVTFTNNKYTITSDVTEAGAYASTNYSSGKAYTITVTDKDGKPLSYRVANIAIKELMSGYDSRARIVGATPGAASEVGKYNLATTADVLQPTITDGVGRYTKVAVKLDAKGQATFIIATDRVNTTVSPIVWIDGDTPERYTGITNGMLDKDLDTVQELPAATFIESRIVSGDFYEVTAPATVPVNGVAEFCYMLLNQNNDEIASVQPGTRVKIGRASCRERV